VKVYITASLTCLEGCVESSAAGTGPRGRSGPSAGVEGIDREQYERPRSVVSSGRLLCLVCTRERDGVCGVKVLGDGPVL